VTELCAKADCAAMARSAPPMALVMVLFTGFPVCLFIERAPVYGR
jgi:hypothetical protein